MNDYIVNGYAVWLSKEEGDSRNGHTWYLTHHGVINPDDGLISVLTTEKAVEVSLKLIKLVQGEKFCLTTFVSNAKEVLSAIPAEERTVKNLDLNKLPIERTLGLQWDTETDTFGVIVLQTPTEMNDDTRRGCMSTLSSTFDPLGMICPVLLSAERVMQETWQLKLHWNERLPEELRKG